jgi:integrase
LGRSSSRRSLFLSAASIAARRASGRLSPRPINTIGGAVGRLHDLEVTGTDRQLGALRPHYLRHTFAYRLSATSGHNRSYRQELWVGVPA